MADEALVEILRQGANVWNQWRAENPLEAIDLINADFTGVDLNTVDLNEANLRLAKFVGANLAGANLSGAHLTLADFSETNLSQAHLLDVEFNATNLNGANLSSAFFINSRISRAKLNGAKLNGANLNGVYLRGAQLADADLSKSICIGTIFASMDLSKVKGLDAINHQGPSYIDVDTLYNSQGNIPEIFLRGCGVPENLITYLPSLLNKAIDFYSCFISYSHANKDFARRLHDRLQGEGIRCWLDEHQLNIGDTLHPTIYEAIRVYDKVLLCCSETALTSWWVEKEFSRAIRKEEDYKAKVLVPLNLDGYLFDPKCDGWVADELKQRLVADFTNWKDHDAFEGGVKAVMKALRTDGGNLPHPEPKLKPKR